MIETEQNKKEDEIKSLKLQLKECVLAFEKILTKEKQLNLELEMLRRDREKINLKESAKTIS